MGPNSHPYPPYGPSGPLGLPNGPPLPIGPVHPSMTGSPFASLNYMAALSRKAFETPATSLLSNPTAASMAALTAAAARLPGGSHSYLPPGSAPILPTPSYLSPRHPFMAGLSPHHPASFHSLLAGLARPKLDLPDYQALFAGLPTSTSSTTTTSVPSSTSPVRPKDEPEDDDRTGDVKCDDSTKSGD